MAVTTKRGVPITASRPAMRPTPNVLTNAADTSRDAQRLVSQPPQPFQNPDGPVNVPAGPNQNFQRKQTAGMPSSKLFGTPHGGFNVTEVGCANTDTTDEMLDAVGEPRKPKGYNPIMSGHPVPGSPRRAGQINLPGGRRRR